MNLLEEEGENEVSTNEFSSLNPASTFPSVWVMVIPVCGRKIIGLFISSPHMQLFDLERINFDIKITNSTIHSFASFSRHLRLFTSSQILVISQILANQCCCTKENQ